MTINKFTHLQILYRLDKALEHVYATLLGYAPSH